MQTGYHKVEEFINRNRRFKEKLILTAEGAKINIYNKIFNLEKIKITEGMHDSNESNDAKNQMQATPSVPFYFSIQ
jgi:hypothetical protein